MSIGQWEYQRLVTQALEISGIIARYGGMITKSVVEDVLMARHTITREIPHSVMNHIEYHNLKPIPDVPLAEWPEILRVERLKLPKYGKPTKNDRMAYIEISPSCGRYTVRIARDDYRRVNVYHNVAEVWVTKLRTVAGEMAGQDGLVVDTDWDVIDPGLTMFIEIDYQLSGMRPSVQWEE